MKKLPAAMLCLVVLLAIKCQAEDWKAKWIAAPWSTERDGAEADGSKPMPVFRWDFTLKKSEVPSHVAFLLIAGLGQYDVSVNGTPVTKPGLHESWTDYKKTIMYDQWPVRDLLRPGRNVVVVMLGNGMYNVQRTRGRYTKFEGSFGQPKLTLELNLLPEGKSPVVLTADSGWKVARGPVVFSSTYGGEDYDARKLPANWQQADFDDNAWADAIIAGTPGGTMRRSVGMDVGTSAPFDYTSAKTLAPNKTVYDFGRNMAGWPHIKVVGPAGAVLRLTPGELLKPDGSVSQTSSGGPQWWSYTLRGEGEEIWEPHFSYFGFRYLQVEWEASAPEAGNATAVATMPQAKLLGLSFVELSQASTSVGSFTSSNDMLNRIHTLIVSAMHNNEMSIFTDCPHREKLGWLEETHLVASGLMFNNSLAQLYRATSQNIADAQGPDGMVPTIAPQYTKFGPRYAIYDDSPEWGSAAILAPWAAYRFYEDQAELEQAYPVMQRYVKYLESKAADGIVAYGLGDWYDIGPGGPGFEKNTTLGVTGTLMLLEDAVAMQKIATLLGQAEDAKRYETLAASEKDAFNRRFWDSKAGWYDTGSQTANAMPLALGIVPEDKRTAVLAHVIEDIHAHQDHVTAGEVGYPYLLRALMEAGRNDVIMAMMMRKDPPSYGSQLEAGATSLTEAWDANPKSSQDHMMLGAAEEWFYRALGGIDFDMSRTANKRITIRPRPVAGVDWVKCGFDSHVGKVESDWRREGDAVLFEVTVPPNAHAIIELPDGTSRTAGSGMHSFTLKAEDVFRTSPGL